MRPHRSISVLVGLAAFAAAALALSTSAAAVTTKCGSKPVKKPTGGKWVCTFGDGFAGDGLNRANWDVMTTATMGLSHGGECFVDDPDNVSVKDGALRLSATKSANAEHCGWFSTPYESGMVFTGEKFAQAHGRFEARLKFPQGTGFASGFWLWPLDEAYGGASGEIDIAELFGAHPDVVAAHTHILNWGDRGAAEFCDLADASTGFHTYTLEWLERGELRFLYDDVPCMTVTTWDPGLPLVFPQPFDKPFFINLTLALGWNENSVSPSTPFPGRMVVDYVRAWR